MARDAIIAGDAITNDGVADTVHYFLLCHTQEANRCDLINLLNEELLKVILYGHEQLSFNSNAKIPSATLKHIKASKRFEYVGNEIEMDTEMKLKFLSRS